MMWVKFPSPFQACTPPMLMYKAQTIGSRNLYQFTSEMMQQDSQIQICCRDCYEKRFWCPGTTFTPEALNQTASLSK